ncbi:hypothetical protein NKG94_03640 [Micromonospora sp. M12]
MTEQMLDSAERVLGPFRDDLAHVELGTPLTHERYTLSTAGTPFGMAQWGAARGGPTPGPMSRACSSWGQHPLRQWHHRGRGQRHQLRGPDPGAAAAARGARRRGARRPRTTARPATGLGSAAGLARQESAYRRGSPASAELRRCVPLGSVHRVEGGVRRTQPGTVDRIVM